MTETSSTSRRAAGCGQRECGGWGCISACDTLSAVVRKGCSSKSHSQASRFISPDAQHLSTSAQSLTERIDYQAAHQPRHRSSCSLPQLILASSASSTMSRVTLADIPSAVQKVRAYFNTHVTKPYEWRKHQLDRLSDLLTENEAAFVAALQSDLRKPLYEAAGSEVHLVATEVQRCAALLRSWMQPEYVPTPLSLAPASSYVIRDPYGVVLLIGPFNYPVQLIVLPLVAALSAGNCVVIKPSEAVPAVSSIFASLLPRYLDPQAVIVVEGAIPETTALLKERWDHIFFTGSETVGKIVARAAAEHLTPVTLELGGKSPVIVDADADLQLAARRIIWGRTMNTGQSCIAPDYVFCHSSVKPQLLTLLSSTIDTFYGSDPKQSPDLARIVSTRHAQRLASIIDAHKADVVKGGGYDVESRWVEPTVLDLKLSTDGKAMQEELFGPVLPVIDFTDLATVIAYINARPKPLALYLFTSNSATQHRVLTQTSSGGVSLNDTIVHIANKDLPFGGVGSSGMGAYHGKWGYQQLSHTKAVVHKSVYGDAPLRYPPYDANKLRVYRLLLGIYRVNQDTVVNGVKWVVAPLLLLAVAYRMGWLAQLRSRLQ